jgi:hypoxanthine-guanine phosphoribosyltransferase
MSKIKRADFTPYGMVEKDEGHYVYFSDYEAEVARLRAEVEKYRKDAERWQHARKLLSVDDIAERQRTIEEWNYLISEDECKRADEAIDAAMGASA